jgi:hypothetical protein
MYIQLYLIDLSLINESRVKIMSMEQKCFAKVKHNYCIKALFLNVPNQYLIKIEY